MIKFLYIYILIASLFSGTTGKVVGKVYDEISLEPIIGCNISIIDLGIGTASDLNGDFIILNVPPGIWT